jgi:threonine dehydrogenase-like Zn-dependent dehydrogenase
MAQSLDAIKIDGVISIIGFLGGGAEKQPSFLDALMHICTVRGILVGSRVQFEEMVRNAFSWIGGMFGFWFLVWGKLEVNGMLTNEW